MTWISVQCYKHNTFQHQHQLSDWGISAWCMHPPIMSYIYICRRCSSQAIQFCTRSWQYIRQTCSTYDTMQISIWLAANTLLNISLMLCWIIQDSHLIITTMHPTHCCGSTTTRCKSLRFVGKSPARTSINCWLYNSPLLVDILEVKHARCVSYCSAGQY